jgi:shikimate kinase
MGSGKSTVAKLLSEILKLPCFEMDQEVIRKSGYKTIKEIFENKGEIFFRLLESKVCKSLLNKKYIIVSTGGGVIMNPLNMDFLKGNEAKVIYLKTDITILIERLKCDTERPLLKDFDGVYALYEQRKELYEKYSDITVECNGKSPSTIAFEISEYLICK